MQEIVFRDLKPENVLAWCLVLVVFFFSLLCFFPMFCCPFGFKLEMSVSEITSGVDANGVAKLADFGLACPMRLEETPNKLGKKRGVRHFQLGLTKSLSKKSVGSEIS